MAFILSKYQCSGVQIIDTSEYLSEPAFTTEGNIWYTYDQSFTVNILYKVDLERNITLVDYAIEPHTIDDNGFPVTNKSVIEFTQDGLHQVTQLIIPNEEWVEIYGEEASQEFEHVYYCDGVKIYNLEGKAINITDLELECSNILTKSKYTFTIEQLLAKFKEESLKVLQDKKAKPLIRNILWIGIDVIKYCLSQGWYFEAERRLQQLINCISSAEAGNRNATMTYCGCLKTQWMNFIPQWKTQSTTNNDKDDMIIKIESNFRGEITKDTDISNLTYYRKGWHWIVQQEGTYVDEHCEVGDMVYCIRTFNKNYKASDFKVLQANTEYIEQADVDEIFDEVFKSE